MKTLLEIFFPEDYTNQPKIEEPNMKQYKVIFKSNFDAARVEYTLNASDIHDAKNKAIEMHQAHEFAHIREDFTFHMAVRTA
jgi:hypothetical protein